MAGLRASSRWVILRTFGRDVRWLPRFRVQPGMGSRYVVHAEDGTSALALAQQIGSVQSIQGEDVC